MTPMRLTCRVSTSPNRNAGFTLIELLIVVSLLLILTTLTLVLFNSTNESDRIRSSARQLQSALLGARDRAIRAKSPRGLRLLLDPRPAPTDPFTISSMVYLGVPDIWRQGTIAVGRPDFPPYGAADLRADSDEVIIVRGWRTDWQLLFQQGLLVNGTRMKIPSDSNGSWYTVDTRFLLNPPPVASGDTNPPDDILLLTGTGFRTASLFPFPQLNAFNPLSPNAFGQSEYLLELQPAVLPGQEPLKLSSGIVINVARSQLPSTLDIMFSPRGLVASGPVLASGLTHFYLCTQDDAILNRGPADVQSGEKLILTLFPQTGNVATFPVDATDPFRFAKIGGTAGR